jgi:HK97 family phage portal protein
VPLQWPYRRKTEERAYTSAPWSSPMGGPEWSAGGPAPWQGLSQEAALRLVPVFGAVRFLADNIAAMASGLGLYRLGKNGIAERQPTPSLFAAPSIHGTLFDWIHKAVISMGLQGDGIGLITQRDYLGFPVMVEWLNPINVVTLDLAIEGPGSYVDPRWYWWGRPIDPADLLHIPWFCLPWRVRGLSPLGAYASIARVGLGAQQFAAEWFENGGTPPGTFRNTTQKVLPDDADEIARRVTRRVRTHQPLVYGSDWEYQALTISPNEARFIETSRLTATQIAVIYGVPPNKIGGELANAMTYSNLEQESIDCLTFSFRPWLTRFEYALSTCFPRNQFVRFDTSEFLRVDAKTRAQIDALSLGTTQLGWKDRNEVRASYNLAPSAAPPTPPTSSAPPTGNGQQPGGQAAPGMLSGAHPTQNGASSAAAQPIGRSRWTAGNGHPVDNR